MDVGLNSNAILIDSDYTANMVVSKLNVSEIFNTASLAKNLGIKNFCAGPAVPACIQNIPLCLDAKECKICLNELIRIDRELSMNIDILEPLPRCMFNENEEAEYVRFFGNRICSAAVSSCAISATGQIRPCIQADKSFGNVLEIGFSQAWENMGQWASPTILPDKCRSCMALMGYVAFSNGHVLYLSDSGYRFLERLRNLCNFTIEKLIVDTGYPQEFLEPVLQRMIFLPGFLMALRMRLAAIRVVSVSRARALDAISR